MTIFRTRTRPGSMHADCDFWGLTRMECLNHHVRVAQHNSVIAVRRYKKSERAARRASVAAYWIFAVILAAYVVGVPLLTYLHCARVGCR